MGFVGVAIASFLMAFRYDANGGIQNQSLTSFLPSVWLLFTTEIDMY